MTSQLDDVTIGENIMTHYVALEQYVTLYLAKILKNYSNVENIQRIILDEHFQILNGYFKKRNHERLNRKRTGNKTDDE